MFSKENRLSKESDLKAVLAKSRSTSGQGIRVKSRANHVGAPRVAVVVGKKVSKSAVSRNRIRRRIRSVLEKTSTLPAVDLVVLVQSNKFLRMPYAQVKSSVEDTLHRAKLL